MYKKLLLTLNIFFIGLTSTIQAQEDIAFILFKLVGTEIKIEKYNSKDLDQEIIAIDKEESKEHVIMSIDINDKNIIPKTIKWDDEDPGKISISIEKDNNNNNEIYSMLLTSFFKDTDQEIYAICFDCNTKNETDKKTNIDLSHLDVIFPTELDDAKIKFVFEEKIKSACGFFMINQDFEDLLTISENLKLKDAIDMQIIFPYDIKPEPEIKDETESIEQSEENTETQNQQKINLQYIVSKIKNGAAFIKQVFGNIFNSIFKKDKK